MFCCFKKKNIEIMCVCNGRERERDIVCMSACVSACLCLRLCVCGCVCARKYVRVMVVRGSRGRSGYRIS